MIDLQSLARHDSQGREIALLGVVVGDEAASLGNFNFTSIEPSFGGQMRYSSEQMHWTPEGSAEEVELKEADLREMLFHQGMGGNLRSDEWMFAVADGRVQRVFLFDAVLVPLSLDSEKAVEATFGPAEGVERHYGTVTFHYPARDIQVHFRPEHSVTVVLGNDPWKPPTFTAQSLLQAYLDLVDVLPTASDTPIEFHGFKATKVRYERLCALLRVFGIADHHAMARGKWLEGSEPNHHKGLDALWAAVELERPIAPRLDAHSWAFKGLLRYRCGVERLLRHNRGVLECGDGALHAMIALTEATSKVVTAEAASIDEVLCAFLDPNERTFSLKTLVENGYLDVDLKEIEMDDQL